MWRCDSLSLTLLDTFGHFWTLLDTFGHFWTLLDTFGHFWSLEPMFDSFVWVETLLCNLAPDISRCFSSFWYLVCCKFFLIYFSLSVSVFCMWLSKHDVCFQASMEEAVPSKEAEEASDEKRREPFFGIELSGCCEWARLWTLESFQVCIKGWNWSPTDLDFSGIARPPMPNPA